MLRVGLMAALVALAVAACSNSTETDELYPACNDAPPTGLTSESSAGQCPAHPTTLTGTGTVGSSCSDATDCAPFCCTCQGTGGQAAVAQCVGGACADQTTVCCLYGEQCGQ